MIVFSQPITPIFSNSELEQMKQLWMEGTVENKKSTTDDRNYTSSYLTNNNLYTKKLLSWAESILGVPIYDNGISLILHKYVEGDSFPKHRDNAVAYQGMRSYVIGCNLSNKYTGGEYKVYLDKTINIDKTPGVPYIMRSDVLHEIEPITSGLRESCLIFLYEHNFKKKTLL